MPRRQLVDALEESPIGMVGHAANEEIVDQTIIRNRALDQRKKLADLGAKRELLGRVDIVERLHAEPVAGAEQRIVALIVNRKRPHAVEALEALRPQQI